MLMSTAQKAKAFDGNTFSQCVKFVINTKNIYQIVRESVFEHLGIFDFVSSEILFNSEDNFQKRSLYKKQGFSKHIFQNL